MSHEADIQPIWNAKCSPCHTSDAKGGLRIRYETIVSVASFDVPSMAQIEPGSVEDSYIWHKIKGTHNSIGGGGAPMPKGTKTITSAELADIELWIREAPLSRYPL